MFNALLGFVVLFVLALLLINPITKKSDIPSKAEIMLTLEWDSEVADDIDIWVLGPVMGAPISFQNKHSGYMHLDRDDLGRSSDVMMIDGEKTIIKINREVVTLRGIAPGDYYINIHVYHKNKETGPTKYTITLLDVNPYKEVYVMQGELHNRGDIVRLPGFTLNEEGEITDIWTSDKIIVGARNTNSAITMPEPYQMLEQEADSELSNSVDQEE
ncbi:uncharacterized protein METZ01_LOCUS216000 [marine metagenome]|uniref:Uncharacterized protein n=1 Tax=marine metagenome TaxID=408172 RepID=A0A382FJ69_9ZZZZ